MTVADNDKTETNNNLTTESIIEIIQNYNYIAQLIMKLRLIFITKLSLDIYDTPHYIKNIISC